MSDDCKYFSEFPSVCVDANSCVLRICHARLRDAHRQWHDTLNHYSDPDAMRGYLNGTLQNLRNVTFALQSAKHSIPSFDQWYSPWQAAMKGDHIMRWAVESRNRVVKESDLITKSIAKAVLHGSLDGKPTLTRDVSPANTNAEIVSELLKSLVPSQNLRRDGMLSVERQWVDIALPDRELLDALAYVFSSLAKLLADCHQHIRRPEKSTWKEIVDTKEDPPSGVHAERLRPQCMIAFDDQLTTWLRMHDGDEATIRSRTLRVSEEMAESSLARYGAEPIDSLMIALGAKSLRERAKGYWDTARLLMERDGFHCTMIHLFLDGILVHSSVVEFRDHADKLICWDKIRREVEKTGANEVILIAEAWEAIFDPRHPDRRASDCPDRREILTVDALNANGDSILLSGAIERHGETTKIGEPFEFQKPSSYHFDEIRKVWGLPVGPQMRDVNVSEFAKLRRVVPDPRRRAHAGGRAKVGRNDPCPCGSGLKFKKCCLRRATTFP